MTAAVFLFLLGVLSLFVAFVAFLLWIVTKVLSIWFDDEDDEAVVELRIYAADLTREEDR